MNLNPIGQPMDCDLRVQLGMRMSQLPITVPNETNGWSIVGLLGQSLCIDRLSCRTIPRRLLQAKGGNTADDTWGDNVDEYLD